MKDDLSPLFPKVFSPLYPATDGEPAAEIFVHFYSILITLEVLRQSLAGQRATVLSN